MERDVLGPVGHLFLYYCIREVYFRLATATFNVPLYPLLGHLLTVLNMAGKGGGGGGGVGGGFYFSEFVVGCTAHFSKS